MERSGIQIILLPQGLGKIRRFSVPSLLGPVAMVAVAFFTVAVTYLLFDYASIKGLELDLAQQEEKRKEQQDRFMAMAGEIALLADRLADSQGLKGHDRAIFALKEAVTKISYQEEKTNRPVTMPSEFLASEPYENMIRQMHESLDYLHAEVNALALLRNSEGFDLAFKPEESSEISIDAGKAANIYKRTMIKDRLRAVARELGLAPRLALSMAQVESGFNHKAVSPRGAIGVLQVMPSLASEHFEVDPEMLFDPEINIRVGLLHMKYLLERFDDNIDLSLAAYNAGVRRVIVAGYKVPPITETREYVRKVKAAMNDYVAVTSWEN
jgi:soluble lytic murein transglycosylase-like protein